jgi:hypothetical protein
MIAEAPKEDDLVTRTKGFNPVVRDVCCSAITKEEEIVNAVMRDFLFS